MYLPTLLPMMPILASPASPRSCPPPACRRCWQLLLAQAAMSAPYLSSSAAGPVSLCVCLLVFVFVSVLHYFAFMLALQVRTVHT